MNVVKIVSFFLGRKAAELCHTGEEMVVNLGRLLALTIVVPVIVLALGFVLGLIGYHAGWSGLESVAYWIVMAGLSLGPLGFLVFWIKLAVYGNGAWIASLAGNAFADEIPVLGKDSLEGFLKWVRSLTAWHVGGCLLLVLLHLVDPIWRHPVLMVVIGMVVLALSAISSSAWFRSAIGRKLYAGGVAVVLVGALLFWLSPGFASFATGAADWALGSHKTAELEAPHKDTRADLDIKLMEQFFSEQDTIRRRAVEVCGGQYCPRDAEKMAELQNKIDRLKNGTYWNTPAPASTVTATPASITTPTPAVTSASHKVVTHRLPPWHASRPATRSAPTCKGTSCPKPNLSGVWSELDQFPDIR